MANKFGKIEDKPADPKPEEKQDNQDNPKQEPGPEVKENQEPHDGDFWTPPPGIVEEKQEIEAPGDLATALVYAVDLLHHELAVGTDFAGWELDDKEKEVWGSLWKQVLPFIAFKYLGIVLSLVIIAVFETIKTGQYMKFRKARPQ